MPLTAAVSSLRLLHVDGIPLAGRAPRDGPCQAIVSVFPFHNSCGAAFVDHGRDQIPLFLIAPFQRHAVGVGELFHKPSLFGVSPGEGRFHAFRREGGEAAFPVIGQVRLLDAAAVRA